MSLSLRILPFSTPRASAPPQAAAHGTIAVERAVAELRAGRPVHLMAAGTRLAVWAAETAFAQWGAIVQAAPEGRRLILSQTRVAFLGGAATGAAGFDADGERSELEALVFARALDDDATLPACDDGDAAESAAIALMKHAQMLPAAVVVHAANASIDFPLIEVGIEDVTSYHADVTAGLEIVTRAPVPLLDDADASFVVFRGSDGLKDQVAIVVGAPEPGTVVPVRLHSACLTGDLFGSLKCDCGEQLRRTIQSLRAGGGGVLLYLDQEGRGIGLGNKMRAYALQRDGYDTVDADAVLGYGPDERRYQIAARMLTLLGFDRVTLMTNNPRKIAALEAEGLVVDGRVGVTGTVNPHNARYLKAKVERNGHIVDFPAVGG